MLSITLIKAKEDERLRTWPLGQAATIGYREKYTRWHERKYTNNALTQGCPKTNNYGNAI